MSDHVDFPPPPPPASTPVAPAPTRLRHPVALFAVAFVIGSVAAGVVGFGLGGLVLASSSSNCSPSDAWCGLGAAIMGVLIGAVTGAIAYVVAGVVTIFRSRPPGLRGQHVLAHLTLPFVAYLALSVITRLIW